MILEAKWTKKRLKAERSFILSRPEHSDIYIYEEPVILNPATISKDHSNPDIVTMTMDLFHLNVTHQDGSKNGSLLQSVNTTTASAILHWTALSAFTLVTFITGTLGNGCLLLLFLKERILRTPFNVYLINLLIANFICVIILYPMDLMANLHSSQWLLGDRACTLANYSTYVVAAGMFHSHMLIAVNRTWALVHPLSYRSIHSTRAAIFLCVTMWIYLHFTVAPEIIMDALYYRLPADMFGCKANTAVEPIRTYDRVSQMLFYNLPHAVMVITFLIICGVNLSAGNKARRINVVAPHYFSRGRTKTRTVTTNPRGAVPERSVMNSKERPVRRVRHEVAQKNVTTTPYRRPLRGLPLLTLLTISVQICWTPVDVYYTMCSMMPGLNMPVFFIVWQKFSFPCKLRWILFFSHCL